MKKTLLIFFIFVSQLFADDERTIMLSFYRCGSHWLGYCLYELTENYDLNFNREFGDTPLFSDSRKPMTSKNSHGIKFLRGHRIRDIEKRDHIKIDKKNDRLILILRNYKECYKREANRIKMCSLHFFHQNPLYFDDLDIYHHWPKENRYLVYYEDLIENPRETLEGVLSFLGESGNNLDPFVNNIESHKKIMLDAYSHRWGSASKGEDLHFHEKQTDPADLIQMDDHVKTTYPHLLPYLQRYLSD